LITCCPLAHTPWPYLYDTTLVSLELFKPTPISLQLDLWLTLTLSHDLYLFELLTWFYSDSSWTWSPPQLGFLLNRIPHPWTLLGSDLVYHDLDSSLLTLKVLSPLWTQTPLQFGPASSIFFLCLPRQLTWVTFTLSAYPIGLPESHLNSLPNPHPSTISEPYPITSMFTRPYNRLTRSAYLNTARTPYPSLTWSHQCLPGLICSYPVESPYLILLPIGLLLTQPYKVLPSRITLPDLFPVRLLPTDHTQLSSF
jgi:hypothetical protein